MIKLKILFLAVLTLFAWPAWGLSDLEDSVPEWNCYYYLMNLQGYPVYNSRLERYDFFDIFSNYCGSLCYNNMTDQWEYFGL